MLFILLGVMQVELMVFLVTMRPDKGSVNVPLQQQHLRGFKAAVWGGRGAPHHRQPCGGASCQRLERSDWFGGFLTKVKLSPILEEWEEGVLPPALSGSSTRRLESSGRSRPGEQADSDTCQ